MLRCKMRCQSITQAKNGEGQVTHESVRLSAVTSTTPENAQRARYTPSASFEMQIDNPSAFNRLREGQEYYVDLTPAAAPTPTNA